MGKTFVGLIERQPKGYKNRHARRAEGIGMKQAKRLRVARGK